MCAHYISGSSVRTGATEASPCDRWYEALTIVCWRAAQRDISTFQHHVLGDIPAAPLWREWWQQSAGQMICSLTLPAFSRRVPRFCGGFVGRDHGLLWSVQEYNVDFVLGRHVGEIYGCAIFPAGGVTSRSGSWKAEVTLRTSSSPS